MDFAGSACRAACDSRVSPCSDDTVKPLDDELDDELLDDELLDDELDDAMPTTDC